MIPRAPNDSGVVLPGGRAWNELRDQVVRIDKITAASPLNVTITASGIHFWLTPDAPNERLLKFTSAKGRSGVYGAKVGTLKQDFVMDVATTTVLTPADMYDFPSSEDAIYYNQPELFNDPVTHWILVDGTAHAFAQKSQIPNDQHLQGYEGNYAKAIRRFRLRVVGTVAYVEYSYSNDGDDWTLLFTGNACP